MSRARRLPALAWLMLFTGCASRDHEGSPLCNQLAELCHPFDDAGAKEALECHSIGHRGADAECSAAWSRCRSLCRYYTPYYVSNPALPFSDGGEGDAPSGVTDGGTTDASDGGTQ